MILKRFIQIRKQGPGLIILGLVVFSSVGILRSRAVDTSTAMSSSGAPIASSAELEKIEAKEARRLKKEFTRKLSQERKTFLREETQLRKSQDSKRKQAFREWTENEKAARRKYFQENDKGSDRREYVKSLMDRRSEFMKAQKEEAKSEKQDRTAKRKAFEETQRNRAREFNRYIEQLQRPPVSI